MNDLQCLLLMLIAVLILGIRQCNKILRKK
jgi:hypothetical protein